MPTTDGRVGWWQSLRLGYARQQKQAVAMFKKHAMLYIAVSLSMSMCSLGLFYMLVSRGVNAAAMLQAVGINVQGLAAERLGTFGIAYLLHKAASPIRFPPTVALTAVIARHLAHSRSPSALH